MVFEDTLQPFLEISCDAALGYVLANQAGLVGARGDLARARALLEESAARFEDSGDERGAAAVLVRRAYLELAEGDACDGSRDSRSRRSSCAETRVIGAVSDSCSPGSV